MKLSKRSLTLADASPVLVDYKEDSPLEVTNTGPGALTVERKLLNGSLFEIEGSPVAVGEQVIVKTPNDGSQLQFTADADDTYVEIKPTYI